MGAKQRAQARGKKLDKADKGSMKGQPLSQKQLNQSTSVSTLNSVARSSFLQNRNPNAQSSFPAGHHGFSMSEEARNTGGRQGAWGATSLRSQTISFVSAGPLKREEDAWNTTSEDDSPQKQSESDQPSEAPIEAAPATTMPSVQKSQLPLSRLNPASQNLTLPKEDTGITAADSDRSVTSLPSDVALQGLPQRSAPRPVAEFAPSSPSSESDEEIVFAGRGGASQRPSRLSTPPEAAVPVLKDDNIQTVRHSSTAAPSISIESKTDASVIIPTPESSEAPIADRTRLKKPHDKDITLLPFGRKFTEDELMQDYIDNMALDDSSEMENAEPEGLAPARKPFKKTETYRMFNGDGLENAKVQTIRGGRRPDFRDIPDQAIDWDSDDLADFDDLSTTDEEVGDIGQVIRHRTRVTGAQYLVIANGTEASDAKWILHTRLISESAKKEIGIYEEIRQVNIELGDLDEHEDEDSQENDSDDEVLRDLIENIESEDDENARIMHYTSQMTDEQIARALAKQEELGLGSDELMLFDGEAQDADNLATNLSKDAFGGGDDFIPFSVSKHTSNRGRTKKNKKQRDSFPSAEAFADALDEDPYGAFDVMDFDRPSLRATKKGRKSDFPWDLEDLDEGLRDQLVNTWTKDREKKAERKRQREEERLTAAIDARDSGDPAMIKTRIRQFLVQDVEVLKLSPMDSAVRASVHRLAKALKLNSRSEGKEGQGLGRYPVLTKTPRTPYYSIETIWEIDALMNTRKFFPKHTTGFGGSKMPRVPGSARPRRTGGGGVMSGATYRDGEEVGASAPELGADNKGRAMLEKMGWTVGQGIGAEGNKGSLDHVRHIVKISKAGLG